MYNIIIFGTGQGANKVTCFINEGELARKLNILAYADNSKKTSYI